MMPVPHYGEYELRLLVDEKVNFVGHFKIAERTAAIAARQASTFPA
jgi:hypothetical protein